MVPNAKGNLKPVPRLVLTFHTVWLVCFSFGGHDSSDLGGWCHMCVDDSAPEGGAQNKFIGRDGNMKPAPRLSCVASICTRPKTGNCRLCEALDEADEFRWRWFYGGWLWEMLIWCCRSLSRFYGWIRQPFSDSFRLIELIAILVAFVAFYAEINNRQDEREARAWQLLTTKAPGYSGKIWALEYLNSEKPWPLFPDWWPRLNLEWAPARLNLTTKAPGNANESLGCVYSDSKTDEGRLFFPDWWPLKKKREPLQGIDLIPPDVGPWHGEGAAIGLVGTEYKGLEPKVLGPWRGEGALPTCERTTFLNEVILPYAQLDHARLVCVNLSHADLRRASLVSAKLPRAILEGTNFRGANLRYADLRETISIVADLQGVCLSEVDLRSARILGSNLQYADLSESNLQEAVLIGSDLQGANLKDADLGEADLRLTRGINCEQLMRARNWETTHRTPDLACGKVIPIN